MKREARYLRVTEVPWNVDARFEIILSGGGGGRGGDVCSSCRNI